VLRAVSVAGRAGWTAVCWGSHAGVLACVARCCGQGCGARSGCSGLLASCGWRRRGTHSATLAPLADRAPADSPQYTLCAAQAAAAAPAVSRGWAAPPPRWPPPRDEAQPGRQRAPRAGQARALCANAGGPRPHPRRAGYYVGLGCAGAGAEAGRRWEGAPMCRPRLRWLAGLARGGGSPPSWWRRCCPILRPAGVGTGLAVPARACPRAPGGPWPRPQSPPAQLIALRASHWSLPRIPVPLWDLHRCQVRPCRRPCLLPLCAPSATSVHRPSAASSCG